jgi:hypothetical protein
MALLEELKRKQRELGDTNEALRRGWPTDRSAGGFVKLGLPFFVSR